ncbi:uncharacterized protein B0I36DRAFT_383524 [Microdochium trichocladiopsis]|uniref:Fungal N-terminal domain-containing protein n=1 Tax=Microdochium trichocladiopsis TaxID=1682393 RepID=A0A9P8YCD4_9PEZI|nr:uncharacterized protein B0I36DRAFT_383524 [Microdochium trichocladiopsis]KAH7033719.1 hypothetical protein B0I36DRAFT_383524 [Microdochium trichocladiopsis]
MSFQVGIGDIVLLAQLSWRISQALSTGRKSAPAELREVEHQLSLLTAALNTVEELYSSLKDNADQQKLASCLSPVVQKCHATLAHLEGVIKKYRIVNEPKTLPKSALGRFNESFIRNWKKIEWTTETGSIQALRDELMLYTNHINLVIGVGTNARTSDISNSLSRVHTMTKDLHDWYEQNLTYPARPTKSSSLSSSSGCPTPAEQPRPVDTQESPDQDAFELSVERSRDFEVLCQNAVVSPDWFETFSTDQANLHRTPMFSCACKRKQGNSAIDHKNPLGAYLTTSSTFPVRQAGREQAWNLLRVADRYSNTFANLRINKVHGQYIAVLDETILQPLVVDQAEVILASGRGNNLAHIDASGDERILASAALLRDSPSAVTSFLVTANNKTLTNENVASVQILPYQTVGHPDGRGSHLYGPLKPLPTSEILITYHEEDESSKGGVRRDTKHDLDEDDFSVILHNVDLESEYTGGRVVAVSGITATIQFSTLSATKEFFTAVGDMRFELYIHSLQYPGSDERVISCLRASQVECHGATTAIYIHDALISIFQSKTPTTAAPLRHRLVMVSRAGNTIVSQVLPDGFYHGPAAPRGGMYTAESYVAQVDGDRGVWRLRRFAGGFAAVVFSSEQVRKTLELVGRTMAITASEPE